MLSTTSRPPALTVNEAMKLIIIALTLLLSTSLIRAEEYDFRYERYGDIYLYTDKGKARVVIVRSSKTAGDEETLFESRLTSSGAGTYVTPKGTVFTLKHLAEPIINDGNRHINSGDWQLTVSGHGAEFTHLKPKMPIVELGDTPPLVYLGTKADLKLLRP
jgi:hypothetical protein